MPVADTDPTENPPPAAGSRRPVEYVHRSWPADPQELRSIRRELHAWLDPSALSGADVDDVVLAVYEAVANVVEHAYGPGEDGTVELTLWTESDDLNIEVADHGRWRQPPGPAPPEPGGEPGMGIPLMHRLMDSVLIHYDTRGSRVLLRTPASPADATDGPTPAGDRRAPAHAAPPDPVTDPRGIPRVGTEADPGPP